MAKQHWLAAAYKGIPYLSYMIYHTLSPWSQTI